MERLVSSFKKHLGTRGVHFYSDCDCKFFTWQEIVQMVQKATETQNFEFYEKLLETMSNYNPDHEFLTLHQEDSEVSIELFSRVSS